MRKIATTIVAAAAVVTTIGLAPLSASAFGGACTSPTGRHYNKMGTQLGLTDKQKQEIRDICGKSRAENEALVKQLAVEQRALRALIHADTVDEAAIRAQSAKVSDIRTNLVVQHAKTSHQVRALLTPEQIKKLKDIQAKRESRMNEMHKRGPGHHGHHGNNR